MEDALNSSINKALSFKQTTIDHDSPDEESGWTAYFDELDFSNNNNNNIEQQQHSSYSCSSFSNPSLISDAASCVAWKVTACSSSQNMPKKLSFKKSRAKEISYLDDSLEDTASSPVNSPKVSFFNQIDMNHIKTDDNMYSSLGKGDSSNHQDSNLQTSEANEMKNDECQDLKKRGLCLVPLSIPYNIVHRRILMDRRS